MYVKWYIYLVNKTDNEIQTAILDGRNAEWCKVNWGIHPVRYKKLKSELEDESRNRQVILMNIIQAATRRGNPVAALRAVELLEEKHSDDMVARRNDNLEKLRRAFQQFLNQEEERYPGIIKRFRMYMGRMFVDVPDFVPEENIDAKYG